MSPALQSTLTTIRQNDYVALGIITAIGYDYVLTFSNEIEYIWNKPWTCVSMLFILVRYCGLSAFMIGIFLGSSFLPGPEKVFSIRHQWRTSILKCVPIDVCRIITVITGWTFIVFVGAADVTMILRVWAMYNRSRRILSALLILFFPASIVIVITAAIKSDPRNLSVVTIQILDVTFCTVQPIPLIWTKAAAILGIAHGTMMCSFVIARFVKDSVEMYRATKQWQLSQYMSLLVSIFLFALVNALGALGKLPTEAWRKDLLIILEYVPMLPLATRFIMSIRELHARDVRGRSGEGIDTAFGLSPGRGSAIVFGDVEQNEGSGDVEEMPMESRTIHPRSGHGVTFVPSPTTAFTHLGG
ncbi:hypothetical protein OG21DRAFT_1164412 [Imleria badia]|nr:hypothetical protein OG21DRAFT_1164412 [Imleria badia]